MMVAVNPQIFKFLEMLRKCESANSTITPRFEESNSMPFINGEHIVDFQKFGFRFLSEKQMQTFWSYYQNFGHVFGLFCFSDAEMSPFLTPTVQSNPISFIAVCMAFAMSLKANEVGVTQSNCNLDKSRLVLTFLDD